MPQKVVSGGKEEATLRSKDQEGLRPGQPMSRRSLAGLGRFDFGVVAVVKGSRSESSQGGECTFLDREFEVENQGVQPSTWLQIALSQGS